MSFFANAVPWAPVQRFGSLLAAVILSGGPGESVLAQTSPVAANPRLTGTPLMRVWRAEKYGAAVLNWRVSVHPNGLVYVANSDGLLEFDGETWRLLPLPREGPARALAIDPRGRVWVSGQDDLCRFDPDERGRLRAVSLREELPAAERNFGTLSRAVVTRDGVYFRGQRQLIRFGLDGGAQAWAARDLPAMLWLMGEKLYAYLDTLVEITPGGFKRVPLGPETDAAASAPKFMRVFATAPATGGGWSLVTSHGLVHWAGPGHPFQPVGGENLGFESDLISAGAFLADGRIAIGTERSGLWILSAQRRVEQRIDRRHGLPSNRIYDLAVDPEGGLWLALDDGVARVALDAPFALHGAAQGLASLPRRFAVHGEHLYVSHASGVARRDPATGRFKDIGGFQVGTNRPLVVGERVVASTRGLHEILPDDTSRQWTRDLIGPIAASRTAPGWILAGSAMGLTLLQPQDGGWESAGRVQSVTRGIDELLDTGDGYVWFVDRNGEVWRVDFRAGLTTGAPTSFFGGEDGLPPASSRDQVQLVRWHDELLAVSTRWLRVFNAATQRFEPLRDPPAGGATAAAPATDGGVWLVPEARDGKLLHLAPRATTRGPIAAPSAEPAALAIAPLRSLRIETIVEEPRTRTLWVAGQVGLASVDLAWRPAQARPALRAYVRRVETAGGELVFGGAVNGPATAVRLRSADDALRVEFAAATFDADHLGQAHTLYRTRLDGLETAWTPWSAARSREFTNLPYRTFGFRVQARAMDGRMSPEVTWAFTLPPPWWLSTGAWVAYACAALAGIAGIIKLRTRNLQRRADQLESVVAARTTELAAKNAELARLHQLELDEKIAARLQAEKALLEVLRYQLNPHFLYNALASVRALVRVDPDRADTMVTRLVEFCRLTLTRSDDAAGTLGEEFELLRLYLEMEKTRWGPRLDFAIASDAAARELRLPPFLVLPLVENAVKYGGLTCEDVLRVRLSATVSAEHQVMITVANTGTWIEPELARQRGSTGIGMENLRKRLRRHFPDAHELTTEHGGGWVSVRLALKSEVPGAKPEVAARGAKTVADF